jgi:hypothetical protein
MRSSYSEAELATILRSGAKLSEDCAQGRITFDAFLAEYDSFYMKYELDGHESDDAELSLFQKHATGIAVHEAVWNEILIKLTADEFISRPEVIRAGFIGHAEGFARLKKIAEKHADGLMASLL